VPEVRCQPRCASALFAVQAIYLRSDLATETLAGLAHGDGVVRFTFALLAPPDLTDAEPILVKDGLGSRDHHTRESAAVALAERGNPAGEKVLFGMLARKKLPGIDDVALGERLLIDEHAAVSTALAQLDTPASEAALEKALASPFEAVRERARAALELRRARSLTQKR
jgi:hypothetical protein